MQAQDIINRAFRALGIIASGETAGADESEDALTALNDMLAEWRGSGTMVPDFSAATLTSTMSLDPADKEAVALKLADRIGGEYGETLSPRDLENMQRSFALLQLRYFAEPQHDSGMPIAAGDRLWGYWGFYG